jgi:hypothetical protein
LPALASTPTCTTSAPFDLIQHHIYTTPPDARHPDIVAFWGEVTALPPLLDDDDDVGLDKAQRRAEARALIEEGQQVYTTYAAPISFALLVRMGQASQMLETDVWPRQYGSLAGGFSSPRITRVLELTSYLLPRRPGVAPPPPGSDTPAASASTSASDERTFERLGETAQWVMACMDGWAAIVPPADPAAPFPAVPAAGQPGVRPGPGEAWRDTVRVRLLHAQMRARVLARGGYDAARDGAPLNAEDLAATLASFGVAPVWGLRKMGLALSARERAAYVALWRHLGFYLGVPRDVLARHFADWARADAFLDSALLHLFAFVDDPALVARLPTIPVLRAVAARGGLGGATRALTAQDTQLGYHLALSRAMLGAEFGAALGLPRTGWADAARVRAVFLAMAAPIWFGRAWRRGWERARTECIRRALPRVVAWNLGRRRTAFWAGPAKGVPVRGADRRWDPIDITADEWVQEGRWIMDHWGAMWWEMFAVLGGTAALGVAGTVWAWRRIYA